MHANLSFEQAPPFSVPLRFFLTAPGFGILAGVLLISSDGEVFTSRWMPATLAATHLLATGFLLQVMCGALLQFIPVAAGGNVWRPRLIAATVHPLLTVAPLVLAAAFLFQRDAWFMAAATMFLLGLGIYLTAVLPALWGVVGEGQTLVTLRLAIIGLMVTVGFGATLAWGVAGLVSLPLLTLTDIHAGWALGGWALMLLTGVSYAVVPMFQLTPAYPRWLAHGLPWALLSCLLAWTVQIIGMPDAVRSLVLWCGCGIAAIFAIVTLNLQARRRRKVRDFSLLFFRVAMLSLLAVPLSAAAFRMAPGLGNDPRSVVWLGILILAGAFLSVTQGMLYKIVPFLCWLHLQRQCPPGTYPPPMNQMVGESATRWHYYLHLATLGVLLATPWVPVLTRIAGACLVIDSLWLLVNLLGALRAYGRFKDRIRATA